MPHTKLIVVLAALLSLSGCISQTQPSISQSKNPLPSIQTLLSLGFPPLPDDRVASTTSLSEVNGKDTFDRSPNAVDDGTDLYMASDPGGITWGIWQFDISLVEIETVDIDLNVPNGSEAWVALADYNQGTWDINSPVSEGIIYSLDNVFQRSPDGKTYIAIIVSGGSQASVKKLTLASEDGWVIVTVDDTYGAGEHSSLKVVGGKPSISYYDATNGHLKYARSTTATGNAAADWSTEIVDSSSWVGKYCSLAEVDGWSAIGYYDTTNEVLKYARLGLQGGWPTWTKVKIDDGSGDTMGKYSSLAVVNGFPYITYYNETKECLCLAYANTAGGMDETDWSTTVIDNSDACGQYSSLTEAGSIMAVGYCAASLSAVRYKIGLIQVTVGNTTPGGEAGWTSLALINGKPAISWHDTGIDGLMYSHSSTDTGYLTTDWQTGCIDGTSSSGLYASLAEVGGRPAVSYAQVNPDHANTQLMLAWSSTPGGENPAEWGKVVVDASAYETGVNCCLADVDGKPAISYYERDNKVLKYAIRMGP